jgi:hypothetical protein
VVVKREPGVEEAGEAVEQPRMKKSRSSRTAVTTTKDQAINQKDTVIQPDPAAKASHVNDHAVRGLEAHLTAFRARGVRGPMFARIE